MATVRIATTEVRVDDTIYRFATAHDADRFEACVATADPDYCEADCAPIGKRSASAAPTIEFTADVTTAEDGGVYFKAMVDGKPVMCHITLDALEEHFDARQEIRAVDAYMRGRDTIHAIAERKLRAHPHERVLIRMQDI